MKRSLLDSSLSMLVALGLSSPVSASSHREAPGIANDPAADITDVYTFKGERGTTHQAFVINVSPAYVPAAGPNWYRFGDDVLYELHIDNNGDAVEDVTYQFQFRSYNDKADATNANVIAFLPGVSWDSSAKKYKSALGDLPLRQTYSVTKVKGGSRKGTATKITPSDMTEFPVAPPRIGPGTTDGANSNMTNAAARYSSYKTLADSAIVTTADGYKFFAGPRNDPFNVDLGGVFNALNVRAIATNGQTAIDSLKNANVLSIIFEVPISEIIPDSSKPFLGVWATTSRPQGQVRKLKGADPVSGGGYVQVSRLGNPLVNEVVIGVKDKDKFNATHPKDDVSNFASYVVKPQLAFLLNALYGSNGSTAKGAITDMSLEDRTDLVQVFVTGIKGVSMYPDASGSGDMIRVNRGLDLGGGGVEGWPLNGRTITDNVVKTALTFLAECKVLTEFGDFDVSSIFPKHTVAKTGGPLNCALDSFTSETPTSGGSNDATKFPYLDLPWSAWD